MHAIIQQKHKFATFADERPPTAYQAEVAMLSTAFLGMVAAIELRDGVTGRGLSNP